MYTYIIHTVLEVLEVYQYICSQACHFVFWTNYMLLLIFSATWFAWPWWLLGANPLPLWFEPVVKLSQTYLKLVGPPCANAPHHAKNMCFRLLYLKTHWLSRVGFHINQAQFWPLRWRFNHFMLDTTSFYTEIPLNKYQNTNTTTSPKINHKQPTWINLLNFLYLIKGMLYCRNLWIPSPEIQGKGTSDRMKS